MAVTLPAGSKISLTSTPSGSVVVIPQRSTPFRYLVAAFILFWFGGWFFGFVSAGSTVAAGKANGFLVFWLGAWTIGGVFAAFMLYRLLRPSVPESLILKTSGVVYDSGIAPLQIQTHFGYISQRDAWKTVFPKRTRVEFDRLVLETLRLRESDSGNRLTVDVGAERLELGGAASEVEREWLCDLLASHYALQETRRSLASS